MKRDSRSSHPASRRRIAVVAALALLVPSGGAGQTPPPPPSTAAAANDGGWPRRYTTSSGASLIVHQPQFASWTNQAHAVMWSAISYTPKGAATPALGTVKVESDTSVAVDDRLVSFAEFKIAEANFPTLPRDQQRTVTEEIPAAIPLTERMISLDRVLANIDKSDIIPHNVEGVKADAPTIFFSQTPAVIVNTDGDPIWGPITGTSLKSAVNTNWDLFQAASGQSYFLRDNDIWFTSTDVKGPWAPAGKLPAAFSNLPGDGNWNAAKTNIPGRHVKADKAPRVFVSFTPAELILLRGAPNYQPIVGTSSLLWVSNTDSDVFRMGQTGTIYFLVSGRWFSAPDYTGPWTFATLSLPADFKSIPLDHPRSRVRASVPGTDEAIEGVLLASFPQTATVSKSVKAPEVNYDGAPDFKPIEPTSLQRAVNTDKDVIRVGDLYYMCFQGVWFMSSSANGPWEVTGSVPQTIYTIPPSSPAYQVTYVTVQSSTSDAVVFATAMAYTGLMVAWGCAVWGTGFYYSPYVRYGAFPIYYPHYPTYGYAAAYNPWTGSYARGAAAYGPYGGAGVGARYNPTTGTYARGARAYGPYGSRGAAQAYNPRTGTFGATRQGSNVYGNWGRSGVQRGDQWATASHATNNFTGTTTRAAQSSSGAAGISRTGPAGNSFAGRSASGDLYAGHDGNVYKNEGGGWQKHENGGWGGASAGLDSSTMSQLGNDMRARGEGGARASASHGFRNSGSWGSGSFRGGGSRRR